MTPEQLQAIRERCEKATGTEWRWMVRNPQEIEDGYLPIGDLEAPKGNGSNTILCVENNKYGIPVIATWSLADAEFIAHARTDLPKALDEIERLRGALESITQLGWSDNFGGGHIFTGESHAEAVEIARQALEGSQ